MSGRGGVGFGKLPIRSSAAITGWLAGTTLREGTEKTRKYKGMGIVPAGCVRVMLIFERTWQFLEVNFVIFYLTCR